MAFYETIFIARQELSAAQVEALAANLTDIISKGQGEITKTEFCGLRTLAYSIKKNRKGHYVLFNIDATPSAVKEMERQMGLNEDILRFLTLKIDALDTNPSPLMQSKQSRDRRYEAFEDPDNFAPVEEDEEEGEKE
jgi:small subunit ribosomal protein S6